MTTQNIIDKLIAKGYKVTRVIGTGTVIATKGMRTYTASSYSELYNKINN